jgi:hypothetical protein
MVRVREQCYVVLLFGPAGIVFGYDTEMGCADRKMGCADSKPLFSACLSTGALFSTSCTSCRSSRSCTYRHV